MRRLVAHDTIHSPLPATVWRGVCRLAGAGAVAACILLTGCASLSLGTGSHDALALRSDVSGNVLPTSLPTRVFVPSKVGIADLYLTDLPEQSLRAGGDVSSLAGTIVHVHVFVRPKAGKTPIDPSATTSVARVFVLTGSGQAGLYAGGGFFLTSDDATDQTFTGTLRGATLYLSRATPGFDDLLGPAEVSGRIGARRDDEIGTALQNLTSVLSEQMDAVE